MLKKTLIYLFGEKIGERLSSDAFIHYFAVSYLAEVHKIAEIITSLASYTRDREKEICRLANLPDISDDDPLNSNASKSAENLQNIEKVVNRLQNKLNDSLPKLKSTVTGGTVYYQAQQEAVECRILEEIREMHCSSCNHFIQKYIENSQIEKALFFSIMMKNLIKEYNAKIQNKRNAFSLHIEYFMKLAYIQPVGRMNAGTVKIQKASINNAHYLMVEVTEPHLSPADKNAPIFDSIIDDISIQTLQGNQAGKVLLKAVSGNTPVTERRDACDPPRIKSITDNDFINSLLKCKA